MARRTAKRSARGEERSATSTTGVGPGGAVFAGNGLHRRLGRCFACAALALAVGVSAQAAELRIGAGAVPMENILKPAAEPLARATGVELKATDISVEQGIRSLADGTLDAVVTSLPPEEVYEGLARKGIAVEKQRLRWTVLDRVPISVATGKGNRVSRLSKAELKAIFTAAVKNWKEVGGEDREIVLVRIWGAPVRIFFRHRILDGEPIAWEPIRVFRFPDELRALREEPGGIAVLPTSLLDDTVKKLATPELTQESSLITLGEPSEPVRKFVDFIRGEGLKQIRRLPE